MMSSKTILAFGCLAMLALGGCKGSGSAQAPTVAAPTAAAGVPPPSFHMPEGGGCAGEIARFRAVLGNDSQVGHINAGVYKRATDDLDRASSACAAGRDGEALRALASTKSRYGYP